jgi:Phasin protein
MTQIGDSTKILVPSFAAPFFEMGRKQFETVLNIQKRVLGTFEEVNHSWLAGAQLEMTLVSDFVSKLTTASTIPDATAACQECINRQMEMLGENSRRLFAESEKLMQASARFFSNGSPTFGGWS